MKTYLAMPCGYCEGVTRAIMLAMSFKKAHPNDDVYVLGRLVHNEIVTIELEKYGIHSLVSDEDNFSKINKLPNDCYLIFSAHGHDKKLEDLCKKKNIEFLDATCPIVSTASENISKAIKENHQVIYVGKKNHPETEAVLSISKNIFLYDEIKDKLHEVITDNSPFISNQTTLSIYEVGDIFNSLKKEFPNATFQNEICNATRLRQEAVENLPNDVDVVYVVGGKDSSNTHRLYELAKKHFSTMRIYYILNEDQIDAKDLIGCRSAAIISGASTPINETNKIKIKLMEI